MVQTARMTGHIARGHRVGDEAEGRTPCGIARDVEQPADEGRDLLRRFRTPAPRLLGRHPQADGPDRPAPDPVAQHALLRPLRPQGIRPVSGLQGRCHQGLLPALQRGALERFHPVRRWPARASQHRYPGLADRLREHRHERPDRPAVAGRAEPCRQRRDVPRELRRQPDGRSARQAHRGLSRTRQGRRLPVRRADELVPRRLAPRRRRR